MPFAFLDDKTRVKLSYTDDEAGSDYINASYIHVSIKVNCIFIFLMYVVVLSTIKSYPHFGVVVSIISKRFVFIYWA